MLFVMAQTGTVKWDSNVRSEASTSSTVVTSAKATQQVTIESEVEGSDGVTWYYITTSDGKKGYMREDLLTVSSLSQTDTNNSTGNQDLGTEIVYVSSNSANIRNAASTSGSIVANVSQGVELYVQDQTTGSDGYVWFNIAFTYQGQTVEGYVRSDLVSSNEPNATDEDPSETEITGTVGSTDTTEDGDGVVEDDTSSIVPESESTITPLEEYNLFTTEETPILPYGYDTVQVAWGGEDIKAWKNGDFFIFYAMKSDGSEGYVRYDSIAKTFQRYEESEGYPGGMFSNVNANIVMIILLVALIASIAALVILSVKYNTNQIEEQFAREEEKNAKKKVKIEPMNGKPVNTSNVKTTKRKSKMDDDDLDDDDYLDADDLDDDDLLLSLQNKSDVSITKSPKKESKVIKSEEKGHSARQVKRMQSTETPQAKKMNKSEQQIMKTGKPVQQVKEEAVKKNVTGKKKVGVETQMLNELEFMDFDSE